MPDTYIHTGKPTLAILVAVLLSFALGACGGSSKGSSSASRAAAGRAQGAARFTALRECLTKQGIALPRRAPGQRGTPGRRGFFPGGPQLPSGVSRTRYEAAVKKCGGFPGGPGRRVTFDNPRFKVALAKFAACMRQNGVNVPTPNTSGKGPVFSSRGLDRKSTKFRTAMTKCRGDLALPGRGTPPAGGAPPAGGGEARG